MFNRIGEAALGALEGGLSGLLVYWVSTRYSISFVVSLILLWVVFFVGLCLLEYWLRALAKRRRARND